MWSIVFYMGTWIGYFVFTYFLVFAPRASAPVRSVVGNGYETVLWVLPATACFAAGLAFVCGLLGLLPLTRLKLSENQGIPLLRRLIPLLVASLAVPVFAWLAVGPLHGTVVRHFMLDFWIADINRGLPEPVSERRLMRATKDDGAMVYHYVLSERVASNFQAKPRVARSAVIDALSSNDISFLLSQEGISLICVYRTDGGGEILRHRIEPEEWPESSPKMRHDNN